MKLAILGKMRSGKDTVANFLKNEFGGQIIKFADPLYEMQKAIYNIADLPYTENTKDRKLLQYLGTQWGRETIDSGLWVNLMDKKLSNELTNETNLYCTDCRFPNEAFLLRRHGFHFVRVERSEEDRIAAGASNLDHESETALDDFIVPDKIYNYGINLDELRSLVLSKYEH